MMSAIRHEWEIHHIYKMKNLIEILLNTTVPATEDNRNIIEHNCTCAGRQKLINLDCIAGHSIKIDNCWVEINAQPNAGALYRSVPTPLTHLTHLTLEWVTSDNNVNQFEFKTLPLLGWVNSIYQLSPTKRWIWDVSLLEREKDERGQKVNLCGEQHT